MGIEQNKDASGAESATAYGESVDISATAKVFWPRCAINIMRGKEGGMTFTDIQKAELAKPLDPKNVKPPKKFGPKGDYIEGWLAIAEANRIFGFDGWSYTIDLIKDDVSLGEDRDGNAQWQAAYSCICTVEAGGVKRQDVGFGSGFAKMIGDAIEGATKEASTDSLKRCLRTFGHPFGLALYDKERTHVQSPADPVIDYAQWAELTTLFEQTSADVREFCKFYNITAITDLPAAAFKQARNALNKKLEKTS